jgi:DNA-binding transcriptional LysR family regulator
MEWDDLKHFLAVSRSGSLTEAARALKTSTSTVARRIDGLEKRLGARLFDRRPSGYTLTESGGAILRKAEEVEQAILSVEREALGRDRRPSGKVRIAASDDIATHVITPGLPALRQRYPEIEIELRAHMDLVNLGRREADIALRGKRPTEGDYIVRKAGWWPFGLYAGKDYAKARGLRLGSRDFTDADIITWTDDYAHVRGGAWFAEQAPNGRLALASDSARVHLAGCRAGMGLAILPCRIADNDPQLTCILPTEDVLAIDLWAVVHRDLVNTARIRAVMDFLVALAPKRPDHISPSTKSPAAGRTKTLV